MQSDFHPLAIFLSLSRASERRNRLLVRDRLLVLAGIEAANMNYLRLSQFCRTRILENNPQHFVGRWTSMAAGLQADEFVSLSSSIARQYPLERAEQLLASLGVDISHERETYYDDLEYAAAILGISADELDDDPTQREDGGNNA